MDQAEEALEAGEVPVGCVFVRDDKIIARARNRTNEFRNVFSLSLFLLLLKNSNLLLISNTGNEACRTGSHRRHIARSAPHAQQQRSSPTEGDLAVRHSRAMHHVRIGASPAGNKGGVLRLCQRPIRGVRKCAWR